MTQHFLTQCWTYLMKLLNRQIHTGEESGYILGEILDLCPSLGVFLRVTYHQPGTVPYIVQPPDDMVSRILQDISSAAHPSWLAQLQPGIQHKPFP